jgi:type III pantothenate kinase
MDSAMLLLVDAGNTLVKWALAERDERNVAPSQPWIATGTVHRTDIEQLAGAWQGCKITRVLLSNVAGQPMRDDLTQVLSRALEARPVTLEWFKSVPFLAGIRNGYRDPEQLGCDRFAAAIGAHALHPGRPLIVATCGTATTIDAVTADGHFTGGMILPGLRLMAASLADNTAQLPQVAQHIGMTAPFADNTADAIVSGCIAAQAGAIERAAAAHMQMHGAVQCIISGGAATMIAPHLSIPCDMVDNLVLIGLQTVIRQKNPLC